MAELRLAKSEVPDGGAKIVAVGERLKIAVFRVGERFAAINNRCPHAGAALGEGVFDGELVKCPLHGFRVNVWKGVGNAGKPVKTYPVTVAGDELVIAVPDEAPL